MKPWREIARPHKDVLEGMLKQSEFAADLSLAVKGEASAGYQDPERFFARTYITEGMRLLLISVAQRLAGKKQGDPVIQLQTNFGGGKTHTLLAVYHFAKQAVPTSRMQGIPALLDEGGITELPQARIAVIDGNTLSASQPEKQGNLELRTFWGQIAWQLLGAEGYEMVAPSDQAGTSPGKNVLIELLKKAAPCVILMDELVAFYRQLDTADRLPCGTLESNMSFIQSLTESVKAVPNAVLLASLPESDTEAVGTFGRTALNTLEKYFGRLENIWKPVSASESFEIVRRRLFDSIGDNAEMEAVCREYVSYYRKNKEKLPPEVQEGTYAERLKKSYPIHPEVFDRLYQDWSTLDNFQKTRGVLQYLAIIIHRLWNSNDQDPMIMPGSIPLDDPNVRNKSTAYLPTGWDPVIESEIDGPDSESARIDGGDTRFGSIRAAHRAARTIFLGSAPASSGAQKQGIALERILLGCAIPGQTMAVYEDVLKRLRDKLHYLFADNDRYRFDTRPNLRREMESRKGKIDSLQLNKTLKESARKMIGSGSLFSGVHVFTPHSDVPDEIGSGPRLVILPPDSSCAYSAANKKIAFDAATAILENRGEQPRMFRNRLFFLAPDLNILGRLMEQCRIYLAWGDILSDIDSGRMNLDMFQIRTAQTSQQIAGNVLDNQIRECYRHVLIPVPEGNNKVGFKVERLSVEPSQRSIAVNVERLLLSGEEIIQKWSPLFLKQLLEKYYFKDTIKEVSAKKVWKDCCSYYQMPRLADENVFVNTLIDGIRKGEYFGFADGREGDKYLGFRYGEQIFNIMIDDAALLIACDYAAQYKADHAPKPQQVHNTEPGIGPVTEIEDRREPALPQPEPTPAKKSYRNFYGAVSLDCFSGAGQTQQIFEELVSLFTTKPGVKTTIRLDIEATSETPFDDNTVRAVNENCKTLKFDSSEFSE